jgi:hypothetical protein
MKVRIEQLRLLYALKAISPWGTKIRPYNEFHNFHGPQDSDEEILEPIYGEDDECS